MKLGPARLKEFFVHHLDWIYAAKAHLVSKLPLILNEVHFHDLHAAIAETIADAEKQISRMEIIYALLDVTISKESCHGLVGLVEDAFDAIICQKSEPALRDLAIIFYMPNIESVEMASFQILQMAAVKIKTNR
nr:DUF892 family protein [Mucilaginibacter endophyticus]